MFLSLFAFLFEFILTTQLFLRFLESISAGTGGEVEVRTVESRMPTIS